jgi:hypothetical protein
MSLEKINAPIEGCIDLGTDCYKICLETIQYCVEKGGKHADASHLTLLQNCKTVCQSMTELMITGSEFSQELCGICADVCIRCAESCEAISASDSQMKKCAEICRKCSESCLSMINHKTHSSSKGTVQEKRAH